MKSKLLAFSLAITLALATLYATAERPLMPSSAQTAEQTATPSGAAADLPDPGAAILRTEGIVKLLRAGEIRKRTARAGQHLRPGDMLITYTGSFAVLQLAGERAALVVDESSRLVMQADRLTQKRGRVYYDVQKKAVQGQLVETDFATLGVKGTRFIVLALESPPTEDETQYGERGRVSLAEGELQVTSPDEPYELKGFDDFKASHLAEFERFKERQQREFAAFKQSFTLQAGHSVDFAGREARGARLGANDKARFTRYQALLGE